MDKIEQQVQERVHHNVSEIVKIVTGIPQEEGATALTVAVAAFIIVWASDNKRARASMADRFREEVLHALDRKDIVEWVKDHTTYVTAPGTKFDA